MHSNLYMPLRQSAIDRNHLAMSNQKNTNSSWISQRNRCLFLVLFSIQYTSMVCRKFLAGNLMILAECPKIAKCYENHSIDIGACRFLALPCLCNWIPSENITSNIRGYSTILNMKHYSFIQQTVLD